MSPMRTATCEKRLFASAEAILAMRSTDTSKFDAGANPSGKNSLSIPGMDSFPRICCGLPSDDSHHGL